MFSNKVAGRYALRHREKFMGMLRYSGWLLLVGVLSLVCTIGPMLLLWWDTVVPAAIGTAIFAMLLFSVILMLPLEGIAYVSLYFDRPVDDLPFPGFGFGRMMYRESGRLDAMAHDAGLPPLSDFESPDVLDTGQPPLWHRPETALPTVEHLLARVDSRLALHRDLRHVQAALCSAIGKGARFYLLLKTRGGVTNAEIEARRHGNIMCGILAEPGENSKGS